MCPSKTFKLGAQYFLYYKTIYITVYAKTVNSTYDFKEKWWNILRYMHVIT